LPKEAGMGPDSWFLERMRSGPGFLKDPKEAGIGPVSLFLSNCRDSRLGSRESELGMEPERLLEESLINSRFLSWARKSGIGPEIPVLVIRRYFSLVSLAMVG